MFLRNVTVAALLLGILSIGTATQSSLLADLTSGGGATVLQLNEPTALHGSAQLLQAPNPLHGAGIPWEMEARSLYTQHQLLLGMLLVLLGFVLHYLSIRLFGAEARVPVHGARNVKVWYETYLDTDLMDFHAAYEEDDN